MVGEAVKPVTSWQERMGITCARKLKRSGWVSFIYEAAPQGGLFVTGAVCQPVTRGGRKGKPNYRAQIPGTKATVWLSAREVRAAYGETT